MADSRGTDFWLAFGQNFDPAIEGTFPLTLTLYVSGANGTTVTVTTAAGLIASGTIGLSGVYSTTISTTYQMTTTDVVVALGLRVQASANVTVYARSYRSTSEELWVVLPTDAIGSDYYVLSYPNSSFEADGNKSNFFIAATQDGTTVTITPSVDTNGHTAGDDYTVSLDQFDSYQLKHTPASEDLGGTRIVSDKPIAVFAGHTCANVPQDFETAEMCCEQMPPTSAWGTQFAVMGYATRQFGDTFRFVAKTDGTEISVDGALIATIDEGQTFEYTSLDPSDNLPHEVSASQPILAAQFSNGNFYDGVTGDPAMAILWPLTKWLASYIVFVPTVAGLSSYVNAVIASGQESSVEIDGLPTGAVWSPIGSSGYVGTQIAMSVGAHTMTADAVFSATVYGFGTDEAYAYQAGFDLPVAAQRRPQVWITT